METRLASGHDVQKDVNDILVEVIIPTLNEDQTIRSLIHDIYSVKVPMTVSILVVDGGSSDGTIDICKKENVNFIIQKGVGKGNAMREAVVHSQADIIVFIDGDGTYSPLDLPSLLEPIINGIGDMVVGSRAKNKRQAGAISMFNNIGNKIFNSTINFALHSSITDSLSGYRAMHKKIFMDLVLFSDRFEIEVEMTVEALAKGYRVIEVPIEYKLRKGSNTKLHPVSDGSKIARTLLFILLNVNPLKFFGILSLGFFIVASWPTSQVLYEKVVFGDIVSIPAVVLSALLIVTGILSIVIGILAEILARTRRRIEYLINRQ